MIRPEKILQPDLTKVTKHIEGPRTDTSRPRAHAEKTSIHLERARPAAPGGGAGAAVKKKHENSKKEAGQC